MSKNTIYRKKRFGYALLLMILIVILIGAVIWYDPMSFFQSNDPTLPWNQEFHLVDEDAEVPPTTDKQAVIDKDLQFKTKLEREGTSRGRLTLLIRDDGTVRTGWKGEFYPEKKVLYDVLNGGTVGNIAPSHTFINENGYEDPTKLYFLTKGNYMILVSDDNKGTSYQINGMLYVRGWIDPDLHIKGEMMVTADLKEYKSFPFEGDLREADLSSLDFSGSIIPF